MRLSSTGLAALLLGVAPNLALAQLIPWVPHRLTHNGPGQFTYLTGGRVNEIGFTITDTLLGPSNTIRDAYFFDGTRNIRLSALETPGSAARFLGRVGDRFLVEERVGPSDQALSFTNLVLHDGATRTPITNNGTGFHSTPYTLGGSLAFTTGKYITASNGLVHRDLYAYRDAGTVNLTNNPGNTIATLDVNSTLHAIGTAVAFTNTHYTADRQELRTDVLLASVDTSALALNLSNNPDGRFSRVERFRALNDLFFASRDGSHPNVGKMDVYRFDGGATSNLTNNPAGVFSSIAADTGQDLIFRRDQTGSPTPNELFRYRPGPGGGPGTFEQISLIGQPAQSFVKTSAPDGRVVFTTRDLAPDITRLYANDGVRPTVELTSSSTTARIFGDLYQINTNADIFLHDGAGSLNLTNNPPGVTVRTGYLDDFRDGFSFRLRDGRVAGVTTDHLYAFYNGGTHQISAGVPEGTSSTGPRDFGSAIYFDVNRPGGGRDIYVNDGSQARNLTNLSGQRSAAFIGLVDGDLLAGVTDNTPGATSTDLFRFAPAGSINITANPPGHSHGLLDVRGDRAFWYAWGAGGPFAPTGVFAGDGFSPTQTIFTAPPGQTLSRPMLLVNYPHPFFYTSGGSDDQAFRDVWIYVDGHMQNLTNIDPGWIATIHLPDHLFVPPDGWYTDMYVIELKTVSGDRRDVVVVAIPEPTAISVVAFAMVILGFRRSGRARSCNLRLRV